MNTELINRMNWLKEEINSADKDRAEFARFLLNQIVKQYNL